MEKSSAWLVLIGPIQMAFGACVREVIKGSGVSHVHAYDAPPLQQSLDQPLIGSNVYGNASAPCTLRLSPHWINFAKFLFLFNSILTIYFFYYYFLPKFFYFYFKILFI